MAMLKALLQTEVPYIGMLGPKKKLQRMLDDMKQDGFIPNDAMMSRVFGPSGLEIDAETPEEIALSIIAEIQAVLGKKSGGMLREKTDVIHSRTDIRIQTIRID
jgi:xanthine dehydrogenase accessory factor